MPAKAREKKANPSMNGLQKPLQPSQELAAVVGSSPLARGQVVSKDPATKTNFRLRWDQRFESAFLQRRVRCEPAAG
jgi:hypothetical protein